MPVMLMRESNPGLWEESIDRRGQCVLWYSSNSCFCISDGGRVDPNCPKCFGSGFLYRPVTSAHRILKGVTEGKATIDITSKKMRIKKIYQVVRGKNQDVPISSFTPTSFTPTTPILAKGAPYTLDFEEDLEEPYQGLAYADGKNIVEVPIYQNHNQNKFPGQLSRISSLNKVELDENDVEILTPIRILSFWANKILTDTPLETTDMIRIECIYEKLVKFVITGINPKTKLSTNLILQGADAQMVFPGTFTVGRGDVVVLQLGEIKENIVGINDGPVFKFPYFKIARILKIEDEYGEITDFTLVRDNEILWGPRTKPKRFACSFTYHPTFSVLDDLPSVRYAEDKIWPKRVYLKKFSLFNHANKVLTITDPLASETGLVEDPRKSFEQGGLI
jgi:hypothetical protein